jgi:hypothetical protein
MKPSKPILDDSPISLDIETSGLDPWKDEIYLTGILSDAGYKAIREPKEILPQLGSAPIVGHNIQFDLKFLQQNGVPYGLDDRTVHDTQLMAHVFTRKVPKGFLEQYEVRRQELNKGLPKGKGHRKAGRMSLKILAPYFLKVNPFWENPVDHNDEEYNRKDCVYTKSLYDYFKNQMTIAEKEFYLNRMLPWAAMLRQMENRGIKINNERLDAIEVEYHDKELRFRKQLDEVWLEARGEFRNIQITELRAKYNEMERKQLDKGKDPTKIKSKYNALYEKALMRASEAGKFELNYDSPTQMAWLLKDYLGLDITKIDDEDEESTPVEKI